MSHAFSLCFVFIVCLAISRAYFFVTFFLVMSRSLSLCRFLNWSRLVVFLIARSVPLVLFQLFSRCFVISLSALLLLGAYPSFVLCLVISCLHRFVCVCISRFLLHCLRFVPCAAVLYDLTSVFLFCFVFLRRGSFFLSFVLSFVCYFFLVSIRQAMSHSFSMGLALQGFDQFFLVWCRAICFC